MLVFAGVLGRFERRLILPATLSAKSAIPDNKSYQECRSRVILAIKIAESLFVGAHEDSDLHGPRRRDTGAQGRTVCSIHGKAAGQSTAHDRQLAL